MAWSGKGGSRSWRRVRAAVLARDGYVCRIKGPACTVYATRVDHMAPWAGRPEDVPLNLLRAACQPCNSGLSNKHHAVDPAPRKVTRW